MINLKKKREEAQKKQQEIASSKTAEKRMKNDIQNYNENHIDNVKIKFPKEDVLTDLIVEIQPIDKCFYRNSRIQFTYHAPQQYPYKPPQVKCINKIFHPNIDKNGNVCLSLLKQGWKATYDLYTIVVGLLHLLQGIRATDIQDPLDSEAATLMNKDIEQFDKVVQQTLKGKTLFGRTFDNVSIPPKK